MFTPKELEELCTFKEIDQQYRRQKGTAFRAFKRCLNSLVEDKDFYYFDADQHRSLIEMLKQQGRIYESTTHAVLLTANAAATIRNYLK